MRLTNSSVVSSRFSRLGLDRAMIASLYVMNKNERAYRCRTSLKLSWFFSKALLRISPIIH